MREISREFPQTDVTATLRIAAPAKRKSSLAGGRLSFGKRSEIGEEREICFLSKKCKYSWIDVSENLYKVKGQNEKLIAPSYSACLEIILKMNLPRLKPDWRNFYIN